MDDLAHIDWIPAGTGFTAADMIHRADPTHDLDDALADVDLLVTGPHASAAMPEELRDHVDVRFTRRLQHDFTDISTSPIARRWAEIDPHVLYVEDPHPRAVRDANRPRPTDLVAGLREAFERLGDDAPTARPSLAGVDAVRPVTFGYLPVYRRPADGEDWERLARALDAAGALGVDRYETLRDDLVERIVEAKLRKLATLDPERCTVTEWHRATHLDVLSIHDTMNRTARPDGAICLEREPADRLPNVVALSNRGDAEAEQRPTEAGGLVADADLVTMAPARLRTIAAAYRQAFDAPGPDDVAFNRPYLGGHETTTLAPRLRAIAPRAIHRPTGAPVRRLHLGAFQNEFLREFLLGPEAAAHLAEPGTDWVGPPPERVEDLAQRLKTAHDLVRTWGTLPDGV